VELSSSKIIEAALKREILCLIFFNSEPDEASSVLFMINSSNVK
jgi:hypothetical protein